MHTRPAAGKSCEIIVLEFRPRRATAPPDKPAPEASNQLCELLDLSRYESRDRSRIDLNAGKYGPDDYGHRIRVSVMALIFLLALVGLAAADVVKLEAEVSCPTGGVPCSPI
jgi:hypothetical protein